MKIRMKLYWGTLLLGLGLLLANLYGLTQTIRHPDLVSYDKYGENFIPVDIRQQQLNGVNAFGITITRSDALKKLGEILQITDEHQKIKEIQELVTYSMVHFFPVGEPYRSNYFHVPIYENYILYLGAKLYELTEIEALEVFRPYEYLNGEKSWERGAAMCGEIASVVMYLLNLAGIESGKAGLDGHVIALAETSDETKYVIDADYGFILQGTLDNVAQNHLDDVHKLSGSQYLANIYAPEGNIEFWNGDRGYRPKGYWFERIAYILKWVAPIFLIIFSHVLKYLKPND